MTEFIDSARREIEERLALLRDEVKRLEAAAAALGDRRSPRRRPGRPRGSSRPKRTSHRRGRRGKRAAQAERLVQRHPGITIPELGKRMKLAKATYLYRVMPQLEDAGKVKRRGREWYPA